MKTAVVVTAVVAVERCPLCTMHCFIPDIRSVYTFSFLEGISIFLDLGFLYLLIIFL